MSATPPPQQTKPVWRAWWMYVALVAALFAASLFLPDGDTRAGITDDKLRDATIASLTQMGQMVAALNTSLFTACGALAIKGRDWSEAWGPPETHLVALALIGGACSYYGQYLAHTAVLERVAIGAFDLFDPRLQAALTIQYYGLLFGVAVLGLVFVRLLEGRKPATTPAAPATPPAPAVPARKDKR